MRRIIVVGAGPAGLAAAERLLVAGRGEVDVRLLSLEPYLGGNASAFTTADGRVVEQGQHIMVGFYKEMEGLLERSGVSVERTTASNRGHVRVYEDRDQRTHHLHFSPSSVGSLLSGLSYTGLSFREKLGFGAFMGRMIAKVSREVPEAWDDVCFTALCLEQGLPASLACTNLWRASREAQFNWPGEISAYSIMQTLREMARDYSTSEIRFPRGSMSELWWEPVAARVESLGGTIERGQHLVGLEVEGGRLSGLLFDELDTLPEGFLEPPFTVRRQHVVRDFDAALLAIPSGSVQQLLERQPELGQVPGLQGVPRLRTVAPMGLHVWHLEALRHGPATLICGLEPPLAVCLDNKPHHPAYANDARFGSVLHFVGQETGFEEEADQALLERAMASLSRVEGADHLGLDGIIDWELVRDRAPHRRYWLSEPGSVRFKPRPRTGLPGLWLAGDWVRSDADFPCMETAIRSGRAVAEQLLGVA